MIEGHGHQVLSARLLSMASMFRLPDELFVSEAYLQILGRPADPVGYSSYLGALQSWVSRCSRATLIRELQGSAEARSADRVSGGASTVNVASGLWPAHRPTRYSGSGRVKDADLLAIEGPAFVDAACALLLGRAPTGPEHLEWVELTASKVGRRDLLQAIRRSRSVPQAASALAQRTRFRGHGNPRPVTPSALTETPVARSAPLRTSLPIASALDGTAVFTIATRSYLPFVRVLMRSLRVTHPDFHQFLLLVDDAYSPGADESWCTVQANHLDIANFDDMSMRYDVVELCTALKPYFFRWLLKHTQLQRVIYVDPDIRFFAPLSSLERALDAGAPLVLTPHITAPLPDDGEPSDHTVLKSGVFNLGFAAIQRSSQASCFLDWWAERLSTGALVDFQQNLFTDQRWCDLAPALVPGLTVLRDSACNVAYWNLCQRDLQSDAAGTWNVDGSRLVFFHFSGFDPTKPESISKYQTRFKPSDMTSLRKLFANYAAELLADGWATDIDVPYSYDRVDGVQVSPTLRRIYRMLFPKPSPLARNDALRTLIGECRTVPDSPSGSGARLSPMMRRLHSLRPDLMRVFDLATPQGRDHYEGWFWSTGIVEHGLVELFRRARQVDSGCTCPALEELASP